MTVRILTLAAVAASFLAGPALAHHSYAMFDHAKYYKVTGTVKEFEWTNPHSWLHMVVTDAKTGKPIPYGFETRSPGLLTQLGLKPDSMKPGDKVTVTFHPLKDGSHGGEIRGLVLASGKEINYGKALSDNPNYGY
jgi:hypothetical protein